jgi:MFS superfamily sulfate permease-like transporter
MTTWERLREGTIGVLAAFLGLLVVSALAWGAWDALNGWNRQDLLLFAEAAGLLALLMGLFVGVVHGVFALQKVFRRWRAR